MNNCQVGKFKILPKGDPMQAAQSEKVDPSQMYSGISMANDRTNQLKVIIITGSDYRGSPNHTKPETCEAITP